MSYIFLSAFWLGIFAIKFKPKSLMDRAGALFEETKSKVSQSKLLKAIYKAKAKTLKDKQNAELSACLSYIKNVAILGKKRSISAISLLEGLMEISDLLKPSFLKMSRLLSVNSKGQASTVLEECVGKGIASDVGALISSWEDLPPEDVVQTLEAYQSALREEKETAEKARLEVVSDLIYFPVVLNSMLVLMNFIYVAYFVPQQESLSILF